MLTYELPRVVALFQPFLRFYLTIRGGTRSATPGTFQPFLRFYGVWRVSFLAVADPKMFQPFLRFYILLKHGANANLRNKYGGFNPS